MMIRSAQSLASHARSWLRKGATLVAVPLALVSWSSTASAQGWLADRRYTEGQGIRTGDLELHPGVGGEVGYDSNWFLRSHTEGPNILNGPPLLPVRDAAVFRITPSLYLSTLGSQRLDQPGTRVEPRFVTFRGGVSATGRFFIGKEMENQHNVSVASDARVDFNQGRPISVGVFGAFNRLIQPQVLADPNLSFNRDDIRGGAEVIAIPGGGTLDIRGSYQLMASLFEESNGVPYSSITHEIGVRDRWRFRPRTALFSETTLRFITYPNADRASNFLNDSTPVRTRFGITGLLTERISALLAAGYSATFFKDPAAPSSTQYDGVNAQAQGTFYLNQGAGSDEPGQATLLLSTLSIGATRDFQTSLLGNFYVDNKLYATIEYWFGGRLLTRLEGYGEILQYPPVFLNNGVGLPPTQVTGDFTNQRVGASFFAEYRFSSTFGLNTTIDYIQQFSSTQIPAGQVPGNPTAQGVYDLNYRRFQAFLGARYFY
jgi:hypothetical protein